jgi:hypothetical protein
MATKKKQKREGKTNNDRLREIMDEHGLGRRDVARLVNHRIAPNGQCYAVKNWLSEPDMPAFRRMPDTALALLELRVASLTAAERKALEGPLDKVAVLEKNRAKRKCFQK